MKEQAFCKPAEQSISQYASENIEPTNVHHAIPSYVSVGSRQGPFKRSSSLAQPKASSPVSIPPLECNGKPQLVEPFIDDIMKNLREKETGHMPSFNYMEKQGDVNEKMRAILVDWLVDVHAKFKMIPETLPLTVNLIDRYLDRNQLTRQKLQLLGVSCLLIASKYEDIYPPEIRELVKVTDNAFTKEEIMDMESKVVQSLGFSLTISYAHVFGDRLKEIERLPEKPYNFAKYLLELALLDYKMIKYSPSVQAAGALYLVNKIFKREAWSSALIKETGLNEKDIKTCAKDFYSSLQAYEKINLTALRRKYSSAKYLEVGKYVLEAESKN